MFPHEYFAAGFFAPTYFPPAAEPEEPPIVLPPYPMGAGYGAGFNPFGPDDEGDEFFLMLT